MSPTNASAKEHLSSKSPETARAAESPPPQAPAGTPGDTCSPPWHSTEGRARQEGRLEEPQESVQAPGGLRVTGWEPWGPWAGRGSISGSPSVQGLWRWCPQGSTSSAAPPPNSRPSPLHLPEQQHGASLPALPARMRAWGLSLSPQRIRAWGLSSPAPPPTPEDEGLVSQSLTTPPQDEGLGSQSLPGLG